jgi:hypothetical protein
MSLWAIALRILLLVENVNRRLLAIEAEQAAQRAILEEILKAVTPAPATKLVLTLSVPTPKPKGEIHA